MVMHRRVVVMVRGYGPPWLHVGPSGPCTPLQLPYGLFYLRQLPMRRAQVLAGAGSPGMAVVVHVNSRRDTLSAGASHIL